MFHFSFSTFETICSTSKFCNLSGYKEFNKIQGYLDNDMFTVKLKIMKL